MEVHCLGIGRIDGREPFPVGRFSQRGDESGLQGREKSACDMLVTSPPRSSISFSAFFRPRPSFSGSRSPTVSEIGAIK